MDHLNYQMSSVERRHKHLSHATSYKSRHIGAALTMNFSRFVNYRDII